MKKNSIAIRCASALLAVAMMTTSFVGVFADATSSTANNPPTITESVPQGTPSDSTPTDSTSDSEASSDDTPSETTDGSSDASSSQDSTSSDNSSPQGASSDSSSNDSSMEDDSKDESSSGTQDSEQAPEKPEEKSFLEFALADFEKSFDAVIGDEVILSVKSNQDDKVNVLYQWQLKRTPPVVEEKPRENETDLSTDGLKDSFKIGGYQFIFEDMTEAELLAWNPDAYWQGKELFDEAMTLANGDASRISIPRGATSLSEVKIDGDEIAQSVETLTENNESVISQDNEWINIEGETNFEYKHLVVAEDAYTVYRCIATVEDIEYFKAAAISAKTLAGEEVPEYDETTEIVRNDTSGETVIYGDVVVNVKCTSEDIKINTPKETTPADTFKMFANRTRSTVTAPSVHVSGDWLVGVDRTMEYITEDAYNTYGASGANDAHWTKLAGGTRVDGSSYWNASISNANGGQLPILSAWYGKSIYVRYNNSSGQGTKLFVPAYTSTDYQTGKKSLYKNAISSLFVRVPETGNDFYTTYLSSNRDSNFYMLGDANGVAIISQSAPLTSNKGQYQVHFNNDPDRYLKDAEGNYRFDSVAIGVCTYAEPDLSGKAAWALKEYINEGYGFMTGHDMMYGYGGVTASSYVPDRNSTTTPEYHYGSFVDGHWNMNWLAGVNKNYKDASPYEAASLVLSLGNERDKTPLYGGGNFMRIAKTVAGNPIADTSIRTPTNYPYSKGSSGTPFNLGSIVETKTTHSNLQIAYGNIWLEFSDNDFADIGLGRLITDKKEGLSGTNNFYLTTNGNIALNQIGHEPYGGIYAEEMYLFANTIMYISQRQQCQVCQSAQGGNKEIHFTHRISSASELSYLNDSKYWYTYPKDGCYMLANDIKLPDDWEPVRDFYGHFFSDGHQVILGANKAPLFTNTTGVLGQYTNAETKGWNLGTDKTVGLNSIVNAKGERSTGTARVSGYLATLFETGFGIDYSGYKVVIDGTDGNKYDCLVNLDGKYVISNLPTTGVMPAHVYDRSGNEVTAYGPIRVNVPEAFWNTNETNPLYLIGFSAQPVKNTEIYEGETAYMIEGAVNWNKKISDITWQYFISEATGWRDVASSGLFDYEVSEPKFVDSGDDSYTQTNLTIKNCPEAFNDYKFRAVFKNGGMTTDTYKYKTAAKSGLLTVKPIPMYVADPLPQTTWVDGKLTFVSSCEAEVGAGNGLSVQWQIKRFVGDSWINIETHPTFTTAPTSIEKSTSQSPGLTNKLCPEKTTATLKINCVPYAISFYQVRAVYSYTTAFGRHKTAASSDGVEMTVTPPTITSEWQSGIEAGVGLSFEKPLISNLATGLASDKAVYEADVYYRPGSKETTNGSPSTDILWKYKTLTSPTTITWTQATANALAAKLGLSPSQYPVVTITNGSPVLQSDGRYKIHTKMEISNVHWKFYSDDCFLFFTAGAVNHYQTSPFQNIATETTSMPLYVDFQVGIKWNEGKTSVTGDRTIWTYPDATVNSGAGVKTLLLFMDKSLVSNFDTRDGFKLSAPAPAGMRISVSNPQYLMFSASTAVSAEVIEKYIRDHVSVEVYDSSVNPKLRAYMNAGVDMGSENRARMVSSTNVSFYADEAAGRLNGRTNFVAIPFGSTVEVPEPVPNENYIFSHWEDIDGNKINLIKNAKVEEPNSYKAVFSAKSDENGNNVPDEYETQVILKAINGKIIQGNKLVDETVLYFPLTNENGEYDESGSCTLSKSDLFGIIPFENHNAGEWFVGETLTLTKDGVTLTNESLLANDINKNEIPDEEENRLKVIFTTSDGGTLMGQSEFNAVSGMTFGKVVSAVPTPVADEAKLNANGTDQTQYTFEGWNSSFPDSDTVLEGEDGDVISFIANFKSEAVPFSPALENEAKAENFANAIADQLSSKISSRAAAPRAANSIYWATPVLTVGKSGSINATQSYPYMQWQVKTSSSGVWQDCLYETNRALIIGVLYSNMANWQYRLVSGNDAYTATASNVVTVSYNFTMAIPGVSNVEASGAGHFEKVGNNIFVSSSGLDAAQRGKINRVTYTLAAGCYSFSGSIYPTLNNDAHTLAVSSSGILKGYNIDTNHSEYGDNAVNGLEWLHAECGPNADSVTSHTWARLSGITVYGIGGGSNADTGIPMQRNEHEAFDITTVWHNKVVTGTPNVVATTAATSKVYDGSEVNGTVTLIDKNAVLSAAQLDAIKKNGSLVYTPGATTAGNATSGSNCIDVKSYTVTFVPNVADNASFAGNSTAEILGRTAYFNITQRPVNLYSLNNNKIYDGNNKITVKNVMTEANNGGTGIIPKDVGSVSLNITSFIGEFVGTFHQTNGAQIKIARPESVTLYFTGAKSTNYRIANENFTGEIAKRPLTLHSLYLDSKDQGKNPRNVKQYDNTTVATISDIILENIVPGDAVWTDKSEYIGTYAVTDAGETLTSEGKVLPDRFKKLTENKITRTEAINLVNNPNGDYFISSENYSGAIYRRPLDVLAKGTVTQYGEDFDYEWKYEKTYSESTTGAGTGKDLVVSTLIGSDKITIDPNKSQFTPSRVIDKNTPAGAYPVEYTGMTEANYPVLKNYIKTQTKGSIIVTPRILKIAVAGGYEKPYGAQMPELGVTFEGWVNEDNIGNSLYGQLKFQTQCKWNSDVRYLSDGVTIAPYSITPYGLSVKPNENGWFNYEIEYYDGSIKVLPAEITIEALEKYKMYGNGDPAFTSIMSMSRVQPQDLQYELSRIRGEDVGEYEIILDGSELTQRDKGNYRIKYVPANLNITPRPLAINGTYHTRYYGDENPEFKARYVGLVNGDTKETATEQTLKISCDATKLSSVGTYPVKLSGEKIKKNKNGLENYELVYFFGSINVVPRPLVIVGDDKEKRLGEEDPELTWSLAKGSQIIDPLGAPIKVNLTRQPGEVGSTAYPIYSHKQELDDKHPTNCACEIQRDNYNYVVSYIPGTLTILPYDDELIIKVGNVSTVYGDTSPTEPNKVIWYADKNGVTQLPEGTDITSIPELALEGTISYSTTGTSMSDVNSYPIEATGLTSKNYTNVKFVQGNFTVLPRPVTVLPKDDSKVYGSADPELLYSLVDNHTNILYEDGKDPAARVKAGELEIVISRAAGEDVNVYPISVGSITNSKNYNVVIENADFTITPADLLVKVWNDANNSSKYVKSYGTENPIFAAKADGLKNGDTLDNFDGELIFETGATTISNVGEYEVKVSGLYNKNYNITYEDGVLEITPMSLVITVENKTKEYGEKDPDFTWSTIADIEGLSPLDITLSRPKGEDVKGYPITGKADQASNPNYNIIIIPGALTITPAKLVVKAEDKTKVYGDENPEWTSKISGFKFTDTAKDLLGEIVYSVKDVDDKEIDRLTDAGTYPINISDLSTLASKNYTIQYIDASLEITKRPIDVTPGDDKEIRDLTIFKTADKTSALVGEIINYKLIVTNTGNVELENIVVLDTHQTSGDIIANNGQGYSYDGNSKFTIYRLPVGQQIVISYSYIAMQEDAGKDVINTAAATIPSTPEEPSKEIPSNTVTVPVIDPIIVPPTPEKPTRELKISKTADLAFAKAGDIITYMITVENTGNQAIKNVTVSDSHDGAGEITVIENAKYSYENGKFLIRSIEPSEKIVVSYTYEAQKEDEGKVITNVAVAKIPVDPATPELPEEEVTTPPVEIPVDKETKGDITIIADPYIKVYGDKDPTLTFKLSGELIKPNDITGNVERTAGEDVGVYPIEKGTLDSKNYDINYIPGTFTIVRAPLVITAQDAERPAGEANPQFYAQYEGFKYSDTPDVLDGKLTVYTTANEQSDAGYYPIVPLGHGNQSKNYNISYVNGALKVTGSNSASILKSADKTTVKVGDIVTYTLEVTNTGNYAMSNFVVKDALDAFGKIVPVESKDYSYEGNGVFRVKHLGVNETLQISYKYAVMQEDANNVLKNVAVVTVPKTPDEPEKEIPSNEVKIPVDDGSLSIVKSADRTVAKVGDTITYSIVVTNTGTADLKNVVVKDTNSGHGGIIAESNDKYAYSGGATFTIYELLVGSEPVVITYKYIVAQADAGTDVRNVAIATIPATPAIPGDPSNPNDPGVPEIPSKDFPSNEVTVPIEKPVTPPSEKPDEPSAPIIIPVPPTGNSWLDNPLVGIALAILLVSSGLLIFIQGKKILDKKKKKDK